MRENGYIMYFALLCVGLIKLSWVCCSFPRRIEKENKNVFLISTGGVIPCLEHISLRKDTERKNMASEREWLLQTVERFSREDALRAEQDLPINCLSYEQNT